jgi:PAS domain S-box-containing protein
MNYTIRILLVEDSVNDEQLILREIRKGGFTLEHTRVETATDLKKALDSGNWDILLADYHLPAFNGLAALSILADTGLDIPFIIVSGAIGEETAVRMMRAGAKDYVNKENLSRLVPAIQREMNDTAIRKKRIIAEAALKESRGLEESARSKIDHIIRSVPDGLIVCNETGRLVLINQSAEQLLNLSSAAVNSQHISQIAIDDRLKKQILDARTSAFAEPTKAYIEGKPHDGSPLVIQTQTSRMKNDLGEATGTVTLLRDVTRERQLDRLKTEFISTAAHEFNTPLAVIIGYLELLLDPEAPSALSPALQRESLELIHGKCLVLSRIVDDLLDLGRIEVSQQMPLQKTACALAPLILSTVEQMRSQYLLHRFEVSLAPELPKNIMIDGLRFTQVLENLLTNAAKYSPNGGTIRIEGKMLSESFHCSITDEGIGLTTEDINKVFEKFYRVDASNIAIKGLGLGLSIVKQIVETHGGTVFLRSELGRGTSVLVTLPLSPEES